MKNITIGLAIVVLFGTGGTDLAAQTKMRIGVFDSRAVAVAYGNSPEMGEYVRGLQSELAKAEQAGGGAHARELEAKGKSAQILAHLQAFSIGSVSEILQKHKSEIDRIAIEMISQLLSPSLSSYISAETLRRLM